MDPLRPNQVTLLQFSAVFIPFGLLLVFAMLWPEVTGALQLNRTKATIWCTSLILIPALALAPFRSASQPTTNLAVLFGLFAYLLFLVHAYLAVLIIFDGIADTWAQMGPLIAGTNFALVILWGLDLVLILSVSYPPRWLVIAHAAVQVFVFLVFAITLIALRGGPVRGLGIVFTAALIASSGIRLLVRTRRDDFLRPATGPLARISAPAD